MNPWTRYILSAMLAGLLGGCATQDNRLSDAGYRAMSKGNYTLAESYLNEALAINPNNPYARLNMGALYQDTGRYEEAREQYEQFLALKPEEQAGSDTEESLVGKPLVEIARSNLALLERQERERALAQKLRLPAGEPEAPAPTRQTVAALPGQYTVRTGDTLSSVAARRDVYDDPLMWPSLYRHNRENLQFLRVRPDMPLRQLAEGASLAYVTPEEASARLGRMTGDRWVINVASFQVFSNAVVPAVELINRGYQVYIPEARVKGRDWMRLRVGFFASRADAERAASEVMRVVRTAEQPWIAQVTPDELARFAGY
jgi:tetratricopeptide (TPR) repeat protein